MQANILLPGFCANSGFGNRLTSVTSCYISLSWGDRGGAERVKDRDGSRKELHRLECFFLENIGFV